MFLFFALKWQFISVYKGFCIIMLKSPVKAPISSNDSYKYANHRDAMVYIKVPWNYSMGIATVPLCYWCRPN